MPIALVTGTSTGIGQATAIALARAGHVVYAGMRNLAAAEPLTSVASSENVRIVAIQMDVDDDGSVSRAVEGVTAAEGRIDVLVNNAGVGGGGPVEETPLVKFRQMMETNFFGVLRCTQAVLPGMRERRSGCIVNISSVAGRLAMAPQGAYAASKWAVEALSECLAQEMAAFNVRVAIVEPGVIATPIFTKAERPEGPSSYGQLARLMGFFQESLKNPVSPFVVADVIVNFVNGDSRQLRHPAGPDAGPIIAWRQSITDEQMVAITDADFAAAMKGVLGLGASA